DGAEPVGACAFAAPVDGGQVALHERRVGEPGAPLGGGECAPPAPGGLTRRWGRDGFAEQVHLDLVVGGGLDQGGVRDGYILVRSGHGGIRIESGPGGFGLSRGGGGSVGHYSRSSVMVSRRAWIRSARSSARSARSSARWRRCSARTARCVSRSRSAWRRLARSVSAFRVLSDSASCSSSAVRASRVRAASVAASARAVSAARAVSWAWAAALRAVSAPGGGSFSARRAAARAR